MSSTPPEPPADPWSGAGRETPWQSYPGAGPSGTYGQYPTAPPVSASSWGQPPSGVGGPRLAGWWYRVGATVIDGLIVSVLSAIARAIVNPTAGYGVGIVIELVYVIWLLGRSAGQTVGMMALGTRVISADTGGPIGYGTASIRWLVSFLLGITIIGGLLDVLWPLWDRRNQTLHDKAARSLVVHVR